jgi:UDP-glucose 4-epimerase
MSNEKKTQRLGKVLVTGGAGYIGSHTLVQLLEHGYDCVVIDNYDNSSPEALKRVREIAKCDESRLIGCDCDLVNLADTRAVIAKYGPFIGCIHFAGFKAVSESVSIPLHYYYNNVVGSLNLFTAMFESNIDILVFSSSCTVYGASKNVPFKETEPLSEANSPYGQTKLTIEHIIRETCTKPNFRATVLRYFNPVGAHSSGRIGENPKGIPNNLLPIIGQVGVGTREKVSVFGNDYDTPDGTGVRDYIHVLDVADAHVFALEKALKTKDLGVVAYNIGTGKGSSVLEVIKAYEKASGKTIPYVIAPRRAGDVPAAYCDPTFAAKELGFKAKRTLDEACVDFWKWQTHNPRGYEVEGENTEDKRKAAVFEMLKNIK